MKRSNAFSLVELLIVIGIIILALGVAVVSINALTGARSLESAQNQVSAMLAVARNQAIGLQQYSGVMFYYDPIDERVKMALVQQSEAVGNATGFTVDVILDLVPDTETISFPRGVGIQLVDNCVISGPNRLDDGYIGFNTKNNAASATPNLIKTPYGGAILFDGHGQLVSKLFAFKAVADLSGSSDYYTAMGHLMYNTPSTVSIDPAKREDVLPVSTSAAVAMRSQVGMVLFDLDIFKAKFTMEDDQVVSNGTTYGASEIAEENWLDGKDTDSNALPLLINRYNGSLIAGE